MGRWEAFWGDVRGENGIVQKKKKNDKFFLRILERYCLLALNSFAKINPPEDSR